jgi:hypothetical protein
LASQERIFPFPKQFGAREKRFLLSPVAHLQPRNCQGAVKAIWCKFVKPVRQHSKVKRALQVQTREMTVDSFERQVFLLFSGCKSLVPGRAPPLVASLILREATINPQPCMRAKGSLLSRYFCSMAPPNSMFFLRAHFYSYAFGVLRSGKKARSSDEIMRQLSTKICVQVCAICFNKGLGSVSWNAK